MKCPNCGAEIPEGSLYCSQCGEEIRFVPDFEPELENAYSHNMRRVREEIRSEVQRGPRFHTTREIHVDPMLGATREMPSELRGEEAPHRGSGAAHAQTDRCGSRQRPQEESSGKPGTKKPAGKASGNRNGKNAGNRKDSRGSRVQSGLGALTDQQKTIALLSAVLILVLALVGGIFGYLSYRSSDAFLEKQAAKKLASGQVREAIPYLETLRAKDPGNTELSLQLFDAYEQAGEEKRLLSLAQNLLEDPAVPAQRRTALYQLLIDDCLEKGKTEEALTMVEESGDTALWERYAQYLASYLSIGPVFGLTAGIYETPQLLRISAAAGETIYYTVDGRDPKQAGSEYRLPIYLDEGVTTVKAYTVNSVGIESQVVSATYEVEKQPVPLPEILPESGNYKQAQWITAVYDAEAGTLYYTTDGSEPNENSLVYENPIPLQIWDSRYRFVYITEDGEKSEEVERSYNLTFNSRMTPADSVVYISEVLHRDGTYGFDYQYPVYVEGVGDLYFCTEYLLPDVKNLTGRVYGINMYDKSIYLLESYHGKYRVVEKLATAAGES
ncbi:MAG: chitobiase/beta-hexosaminidase C-terminal domain-containing protein [Lachnospiraceae bacterium]|nr:chitobiase/beta-hexosaminidase C-terminal domain-containing protein [Lachnospiraceae bacterium]